MERITDPVAIRDYNENGDIAFVGYMQPGWPGEWPCRFVFSDGETGVVRFIMRENSVSFGNNTTTGDKYIYAEIGSENEPYLRYNVTINKWELYPAPSGGIGPILAEHVILDQDIHTDTVSAAIVLGDLFAVNATPKWQRLAGNATTQRMFLRQVGTGAASALPGWDTINASTDITAGILPIARGGTGLDALGAANQLLGVNGAGSALEYKNISSLVSAGSGIGVSGTATITISNTGVLSLNTLTGALTLAGTANQVNVNSGGSTITLSTPQNIHTGASPTFAGITLTGLTGVLIGNGASAVSAVAATAGSLYFRRNAGHSAYEFGTILDGDIPATIVRTSRQILTGTGLSGGGDLSADRTLSWNGLTVRKNSGANAGTRRRLNLIEGSGVTLTTTDDAADDEIDVTIASTVTGGVTSLNGLTGALTLAGTTNQVNVNSGGSTITLSTPQNIHTGATVEFARLGLGRASISGNTYFHAAANDSSNANIQTSISNATARSALLLLRSRGSNYSESAVLAGDRIGALIFMPFVTGFSGAAAVIDSYVGTVGATLASGDIRFSTRDTALSFAERLRIDTEGRLGIGTASPGYLLDVNGNGAIRGQIIAGSGLVALTDATGKIQALTSTYFASLDASSLTGTLTVRKNSVAVGSPRRQFNMIESSGMQIDVVDDGTEFDVTPRVKRMIVLPIPGDPAQGATVSIRLAAQTGGTITSIRHICTTAAATTYTYDVNKNGTTIYTTQGNRPTRTSGNGTSLITATAPDVTSFSANDIFEIDLDTKGTGIKDIVFFIQYTEN